MAASFRALLLRLCASGCSLSEAAIDASPTRTTRVSESLPMTAGPLAFVGGEQLRSYHELRFAPGWLKVRILS